MKSKDYVGISHDEFYGGSRTVQKLEYLLDDSNYEKNEEETSVEKSVGGNINKWIVLILLSIVALSWGIWTAIGVFILGAIMINLLKS